jgi:hypothetical protein
VEKHLESHGHIRGFSGENVVLESADRTAKCAFRRRFATVLRAIGGRSRRISLLQGGKEWKGGSGGERRRRSSHENGRRTRIGWVGPQQSRAGGRSCGGGGVRPAARLQSKIGVGRVQSERRKDGFRAERSCSVCLPALVNVLVDPQSSFAGAAGKSGRIEASFT